MGLITFWASWALLAIVGFMGMIFGAAGMEMMNTINKIVTTLFIFIYIVAMFISALLYATGRNKKVATLIIIALLLFMFVGPYLLTV